MKISSLAGAAFLFAGASCAQSPTPPQPPEPPEVTTVTEDCGEDCTRTVTTVVTSDTASDGTKTRKKDVEIIELRSGDLSDIDIDVDVEELAGADGVVRKKVKVISATSGEISPEMRDEIEAMISNLGVEDGKWHTQGDGVMVFNSEEGSEQVRVLVRENGEKFMTGDAGVTVEETENADGSRTIRVVPKDGGETTVITIRKE